MRQTTTHDQQHALHRGSARAAYRLALPVSNITSKLWGGVPICIHNRDTCDALAILARQHQPTHLDLTKVLRIQKVLQRHRCRHIRLHGRRVSATTKTRACELPPDLHDVLEVVKPSFNTSPL